MIGARTRAQVRERAQNTCEYCRLHQDDSPLAALHIKQGMEMLGEEGHAPAETYHPVELMALAYGLLPPAPPSGAKSVGGAKSESSKP